MPQLSETSYGHPHGFLVILDNKRIDVLMKWEERVQVGEVYILSSRQASAILTILPTFRAERSRFSRIEHDYNISRSLDCIILTDELLRLLLRLHD